MKGFDTAKRQTLDDNAHLFKPVVMELPKLFCVHQLFSGETKLRTNICEGNNIHENLGSNIYIQDTAPPI